jgi:hypothetical protein
MTIVHGAEYFERALGAGLLNLWAELPREIQEQVFEAAVLAGHRSEADESLREQLAEFLHDRHPRTGNQGTAIA